MKVIWNSFWLCWVLVFASCSEITFEGNGNDVPTAGTVRIGFEPGDTFMVNQWLEIFKSQYPKATIHSVFKEKEQLIELLLSDSLNGVFLHDTFSLAEINWLSEKKNATVNQVLLGYTAPVFVVSLKNELQGIDFNDELCLKNAGIEKLIMRDPVCSEEQAIQKYLKSQIKDTLEFKKHYYTRLRREKLPSDKEIIEYLAENPKALGLVSLNSVADRKDSLAMALQKMIKIIPVKNRDGQYHLPFQSQLKTKQYPIIQPLMSYEMQGYGGLIKGFVIYTYSQSGQALLQKSGLLPENHQGRKIQIDVKTP